MSTMLSPNSLQPPKTGVSRWSKALPEVPGIDFDDIYGEYEDDEDDDPLPVSPENKGLPRLPLAPPPPRSTSMSANVKSLNSSLPPLPIVDTAPAPLPVPTGPPKMAIPRRPVGKQLSRPMPPPPAPQQPQQQEQQQQLPQPPSPAQSISSILSAYSKGSSVDGSPSDNNNDNYYYTNTRQSGANPSSPSHNQAPPPPANTKMGTLISPSSSTAAEQKLPGPQTQQQHVAPIRPANIKVNTDIPPPPPTKDSKYGLVASPASTTKSPATATSAATASDLTTSSPPRPQIWRRRSVKTERNLDFPDLKLVGSHGSTAASASASVPASVLQSQPVAIKPVAAAYAATVAQTQVQSHTRAQSGSKTAFSPVAQSRQPSLPPGVIKVSPLTYQSPKPNNYKSEVTSIKNAHPAPPPAPAPAPASAPAPAPAPAVISAPPPAPAPSKAVDADSPTMGNGGSKLNKLKDKLHTFHRRGKSSVDTSSDSTGRPGAHRPPTPEYQKQDVKTPIIDSFVSPLSPASSPEPLAEVSPDLSKDLPKSPQENHSPHESIQLPSQSLSPNGFSVESKPPTRKAVPRPTGLPANPKPETKAAYEPFPPIQPEPVRLITEQKLEVVTKTQSPLSGSLPPLANDTGSRPSSGTDSPASRAHHSAEVTTKFPPRGSSVRSNAPRPYEQQSRHPPEDLDPRLVPSESQGYLYRGRDGTLYPEMRVTREPDPQASYFPTQAEKLTPVDTIFSSVPLKDSHYNCYQGHRTMNRRTNRNYPLTCQTCEKPDAEDRWVCTFCHLRICESCFTTLNGRQRNLGHLVQDIKQQTLYA